MTKVCNFFYYSSSSGQARTYGEYCFYIGNGKQEIAGEYISAGRENRTPVPCLEGRRSTTKLCPHGQHTLYHSIQTTKGEE